MGAQRMPFARPQRRRVDQPRPEGRGLRQAGAALRHRNFALFWTGALTSNIGTWMQNVTVPFVLLYVMHAAPVWVGVAAVGQFIPGVILGPIGGALADRFPRRRVIVVSQAFQAVIAFIMWGAWVSEVRSPVFYVAMVGAIGVANGMNGPAYQAYVSELVPREDLFNAVTLNSAQFNGARAVGPALTGLVLASLGPSWAFLLNGVSFVAVIGALMMIDLAPTAPTVNRRPILREFAEGASYARHHTGIAVSVVVATLVAFFALPVAQVATIVAKDVFDVSAAKFGILLGSYGAGAVIGAVILGSLGSTSDRGRTVLVGVFGFTVSLAVFGLAPAYWLAVVALGACGACFVFCMATLNTSIQLQVPEHLRGRVLAAYFMAFTGGYPMGSLLQSWMAGRIGARETLLLAAVCMLVLGIALVMRPVWLRALEDQSPRIEEPDIDPLAPLDSAPLAGAQVETA
jgi:MFS family permease